MKTLFIIIALFALSASADVTTNLLSLAYINGTNNGGVYYASNVIVPPQRYLIQSLGITNGGTLATNYLTVYVQWSVDPANGTWSTVATYHPSTTNNVVEILQTNIGAIRIPMRMQVVTTNSIGVAVYKENN